MTQIPDADINYDSISTYVRTALSGILREGSVSEDGNVYSFYFNLDNVFTGTLGSLIESFMPSLGEAATNLIYGLFDAQDWDGFVANLPSITGTMQILFDGNTFEGISLSNFNYESQKESGVFMCTASPVVIKNGSVDVAGLIPADKDSYTATKMLNFDVNGTIDIMSETTTIGKLRWTLKTNLDPVLIALVKGNLSDEALAAKNNMLHFSLYFDDSDSVTNQAFLAARKNYAQNNIIDIVYDPANTGTGMLYISANLDNILSKKVFDAVCSMASMASSLVEQNVNKTVLIPLDINALLGKAQDLNAEPSEPGEPGEGGGQPAVDIGAIMDKLAGAVNMIGNIVSVENQALNLNYNEIVALLEDELGSGAVLGSLSLADIVGSILGIEQEGNTVAPTNVRFTIDSLAYGTNNNDGYNALVSGLQKNSYGKEAVEDKAYNENFAAPALKTKVITSNVEGKNFIDLYAGVKTASQPNNSAQVYKVSDGGALAMLSLDELKAISGYGIHYTYTDIYGKEHINDGKEGSEYCARITGISGLDVNSKEPQLVTIYTTPMDAGNIITSLNSLLGLINLADLKFAAGQVQAYVQINAEVESTTAKGGSGFISSVENGETVNYVNDTKAIVTYGAAFGSIFKQMNVTMNYVGGKSKTVTVEFAESDISFADESKIKVVERSGLGNKYPEYQVSAAGKNSVTISTTLGDFTWNYEAISEDQLKLVIDNGDMKIGENMREKITAHYEITTESGEIVTIPCASDEINFVNASDHKSNVARQAGEIQVYGYHKGTMYKPTATINVAKAESVDVQIPATIKYNTEAVYDVIKQIATVDGQQKEVPVDYSSKIEVVDSEGAALGSDVYKNSKFLKGGTYTVKFTNCNGDVVSKDITVEMPARYEFKVVEGLKGGTSLTSMATLNGVFADETTVKITYAVSDLSFYTDADCTQAADIINGTKFKDDANGTFYVKVHYEIDSENVIDLVKEFTIKAKA